MRFALAGAMAVVPLFAWAQEGSEACVLSSDDFAALSGWKAYIDPGPMPWGSGAVCGYDGGQILLFSGDASMENLERVWVSFGAAGERVPVPELGADAFAFFVKAENEYQDDATFVVFSVGAHAVAVTVYAREGEPAEAALPEPSLSPRRLAQSSRDLGGTPYFPRGGCSLFTALRSNGLLCDC